MKTKEAQRNGNKGFVLPLAGVMVVLLSVMGLGLLRVGLSARVQAAKTTAEIAARAAADAGLRKAIFEMNERLKAQAWSDMSLPVVTDEALPYSNETFSYEVGMDSSDTYSVISTGRGGPLEKQVCATVRLQGLFEYALFTKDNMLLKNGTTIDGYNYGAKGKKLKIGTNSTKGSSIISKTGVTIDGDVVVGVGGDPSVVIDSKKEAVITGKTYAASEEHNPPPVTVPQSLLLMPSGPTITTSTTISNDAVYDSINLSNGRIIRIDRAVTLYVIGDVILDNSAVLRIVDANTGPHNASLTLYLGGNLLMQNGGTINNATKNPKKLKIFGLDSCLSMAFKTAGSFYGVIYGPNADVRAYNAVQVFGAVSAKSFTQDVNADLHYDASLREASTSDEGVSFVVKYWHE